MKKLILVLSMFLCALILEAQPVQVQSAFNFQRRGQLDRAKEAIDKAAVHERTATDPKTWFYKGNIYLDIFLSEEKRYRQLDENALNVAYDAFQKAVKLDEDNEYLDQIRIRLYICGEQFYNLGVELFNEENFEEAVLAFDRTARINAMFQVQDSLATYNAALSAQLSGQTEKAKEYYLRLVRMNYQQPNIYLALYEIYQSEADTAQMLSIIERGRERFPENYNLIITETNLHLSAGNIERAQETIELALEQNPTNPNLYFALGANYDELGRFEDAEQAYLKALELKPEYFNALYNIGALYFNKGVEIFEKADQISPTAPNSQERYDKKREQFEELWGKALPYLEQAHELNPDDRNTLISLSQLYARTRDYENAQRINQILRGEGDSE